MPCCGPWTSIGSEYDNPLSGAQAPSHHLPVSASTTSNVPSAALTPHSTEEDCGSSFERTMLAPATGKPSGPTTIPRTLAAFVRWMVTPTIGASLGTATSTASGTGLSPADLSKESGGGAIPTHQVPGATLSNEKRP